MCVIIVYGVEDFVDGSDVMLERFFLGTTKLSLEYAIWNHTNRIIRCLIYTSLSSKVSSYLTGHKTIHKL